MTSIFMSFLSANFVNFSYWMYLSSIFELLFIIKQSFQRNDNHRLNLNRFCKTKIGISGWTGPTNILRSETINFLPKNIFWETHFCISPTLKLQTIIGLTISKTKFELFFFAEKNYSYIYDMKCKLSVYTVSYPTILFYHSFALCTCIE